MALRGRTDIFIVASALTIAAGTVALAHAQSWPSRFVTLVVAFPAGGPTDVLARAVASDLADRLGQQFVV